MYITLALQTLGSFVVLFILAKISGYRQISQMSMFDYVNGITIGSIAAEMATGLDAHWSYPLTSMVVFGLLTLAVSCMTDHSLKFRRFMIGEPIILLHKGKLYKQNLKKAHINIDELLESCRINGYFSLSELQTILMESSGKFSFIPAAGQKPVTASDMNLPAEADSLSAVIITDGLLLTRNLKALGRDENWVHKKLQQANCKTISSVFLAVFEQPDELLVFPKDAGQTPPDLLF